MIVAILLAPGAPALAASETGPGAEVARRPDAVSATDVSARRPARRHVRHHRHLRRAVTSPTYYARPTYYRPHGIAPFFPFGLGYGLEPSW
ncbi:hypothetical protein HNR60_000297 [Rhodopseudomonas rhenobacensis]|uniref:Uncharacterized protein n=1 Tax=Rhodopseudomonas rhenobacensis TaxID=87461 RepID=A0A7W7Z097_9BRAD|nr:hypothetical protein [Rhodopseudomonas rhenobacensis]